MANLPLILAGVGFGGLLYYSMKRKPTGTPAEGGGEDGGVVIPPDAEPYDHPGLPLPPAPTPTPPPKEPAAPKGGIEGKPWAPPPKAPKIPACKESAKITEGSMNLPPTLWTSRGTGEITLLIPSPDCNKYKMALGVCIQPVDYHLDPGVVFLSQETMDAFADKAGGGLSNPIDWNEFKSPAWIGLFETTVKLPVQGNIVLVKSNASAMIPKQCEKLQSNWPTPQGKFYVHASDNTWKLWNPVPRVSLKPAGKNIKAVIEFSGFPIVKDGRAQLDKKSTVKLSYKTWTIGV